MCLFRNTSRKEFRGLVFTLLSTKRTTLWSPSFVLCYCSLLYFLPIDSFHLSIQIKQGSQHGQSSHGTDPECRRPQDTT